MPPDPLEARQLPDHCVSAAQVDFIEANQRLTSAMAERDGAASRYKSAERYFHDAWDRMTEAEQQGVNAGLQALNEPETVAREALNGGDHA